MATALNVLLIEDNADDVRLLVRELERNGFEPNCRTAHSPQELVEAMEERPWDVVLCDYGLPLLNGEAALRMVRSALGPYIPVIFVSGGIGEEIAVRLMREGAQDYVLKNNLIRLPAVIKRELSAARVRYEREQADEKLDEERRLLRQLMANIPDAIYFKDLQRRYIGLNEAECRMLHASNEDEVIGHTADDFLPPDQARVWREQEETMLATGEPVTDAIERVNQADGTIRWYSMTKAPLRDRRGNITGMVGISRDITWRKLNDQMKDEFIATVSHELRTPLTSIAGSLGLLTGGAMGDLSEPVMRLLKIAHGNCERLVRLTNEILDMGRIERGRLELELEPVDVRALVEEAIEANRGFANKYGITVDLAEGGEGGFVLADHDRLTQVVTNLLSNAVKFSPQGAAVDIGVAWQDNACHLTVRDHGPGIPESFRGRIFERFVQVDATDAREKGGTGLGLSIVKQIVESLGGTVDFRSARGGGTVFEVVLPQLKPSTAGEPGLLTDEAHSLLIGIDEPDFLKKVASRELRRGKREGRFALLRLHPDQYTRVAGSDDPESRHAMLRAITGSLKKMVRGTDGICFAGDGDLLLLMPSIELDKAQERAEYFRQKVKELRVPVNGQLMEPLSFSIGLAHFPTLGGSYEALVRFSTEALKRARSGGGDRVVLAEADMAASTPAAVSEPLKRRAS